ncbi:putative nucleotidyltransferase substrate binding domain-containing protein [Vibrio ostreicida]|uniref:Nucleotidyltransferase substrate binding domain-containing protein n=1 Tax=Vibrio ostreicida TaxID=526588 RepID=A0ABT8BQU0_9VIBR|nr:putative nucleotidyltransferase substrate binding domain-containing protein [Vibrio ostreicida]MDN3608824.1 putative nucleotidyltransferase substrate binding domain-containing protein [Vibrio ostreicida]NPD10921.1 cyclic nucleotide-binding/CBS domain-containing protein [Vibrio ostreicida]
MPDKFNMNSPPFSHLDPHQQAKLRAALDVAYYREREAVLLSGDQSEYLNILIKGVVEERSKDGQEVFAHYANDDLFDVRALFEGHIRHGYVALEDTLSYLLPKAVFLELYHSNRQFAAYFDNNLAKRQQLLETAKRQQNLAEFILTKVDRAVYHPPLIVASHLPLNEVTLCLKEHDTDAALVKLDDNDIRLTQNPGQQPYSIVTQTNILHAVLLDGYSHDAQVGGIASFPVVSIDDGDFLFNAMIKMTRQRLKRVMVSDGREAVGMLDMTQILSAFSTHSHVLTLSIARATTIDELMLASNRQNQLVDNLLSNGIRTRFIMALISAINEQIIEKAFELIVPPALQDQCCFVVLGSEGRGEQILKTDQDNALIIKDGLLWHQCDVIMNKLTQTLQQLGYPLCPGQVMVNNTKWVKSQTDWKNTLTLWSQSNSAQDIMDLAIFSDAHAVAGDKQLLDPVRHHLKQRMLNNMLALQDFTRPALQFALPLTLFGKVKSDKKGIDLKSGGIFPIVHGIRALALEHGVDENNTFERIEALHHKRILESDTADNLNEALKLLFKLRLSQQVANQHSHNRIDLKQLDRAERDLLRHSLHVIKKFKQFLAYHYQIRE